MRQLVRLSTLLVICSICSVALAAGSAESYDPVCLAEDTGPKFADEESGSAIRDDRLLIKLTAEAAALAAALPEYGLPRGVPELDRLLERHGIRDGFRVVREHGLPIGNPELFAQVGLDRLYALRLPEPAKKTVWELVRELERQPWVEYAEPVYIGHATLTVPNDPRFPDQWAHDNTGQTGGTPDADIDSPEGWDFGTGSSSGVVAILDSGADLDHEDLVANIIPGFDFVNNDSDPDDDNGHGTQAAGIAAARGNNAIGVAGVCWSCGIMPLKVLNSGGSGSTDDMADAIRYAADNGADTISMSLAFGRTWYQSVIDAADYALGQGSLSFASAGNAGAYYPRTPAAYPNFVSVGGTDEDDARIYDYGDHAELSAPAPNTLTTQRDNQYGNFGGTSSSCPHSAGLGAMLRAQDPSLHVRELRYLLRLGADDGVGTPSEDTPGWDQFMGFGRLNSHGSMSMVDGPWLTTDRPHYVCAGQLTVALKDKSAGGSVDVTLSSDADSETVTVTPVTGNGYYEGSIPISWIGRDGPAVPADGKLDVEHGHSVTTTVSSLSATADFDCLKEVCRRAEIRTTLGGDCDRDGAADPGELWSLSTPVLNFQTEEMFDVVAVISTSDANVEILDDTATYGSIIPFDTDFPDDDGSNDPFRIRVHAGAPSDGSVSFTVSISGRGWESDDAACDADGRGAQFSIPINRDLGSQITQWDFDDGTAQGFTHSLAHLTGNLSECPPPFLGTWRDDWNDLPASDKSHSGSFAMRLGNGFSYLSSLDAGLMTPSFTVPAGGGAIGFFMWMDSELTGDPRFAWDGMIVEAKPTGDLTWSFLPDATYNTDENQGGCDFFNPFPFGTAELVDLVAGDGTGTGVDGDTFDREHQANLSAFAGQEIQVRFRFGADGNTQGTGTWIDTVNVYDTYSADAWPGDAPSNLQGSDAACPASFDLTWNAVAGAEDYRVYRSDVSCADAGGRPDVYGTSSTPDFSDTGVVEDVGYFYAVEARESGSGCPTERSCISGGCCAVASDPTGLEVNKDTGDVLLTWNDPAVPGLTWNVYRDMDPNPANWGAPHATGVTDEDPGTPGIQYTDVGAVGAGSPLHYLVTAVNSCGESALR